MYEAILIDADLLKRFEKSGYLKDKETVSQGIERYLRVYCKNVEFVNQVNLGRIQV